MPSSQTQKAADVFHACRAVTWWHPSPRSLVALARCHSWGQAGGCQLAAPHPGSRVAASTTASGRRQEGMAPRTCLNQKQTRWNRRPKLLCGSSALSIYGCRTEPLGGEEGGLISAVSARSSLSTMQAGNSHSKDLNSHLGPKCIQKSEHPSKPSG